MNLVVVSRLIHRSDISPLWQHLYRVGVVLHSTWDQNMRLPSVVLFFTTAIGLTSMRTMFTRLIEKCLAVSEDDPVLR